MTGCNLELCFLARFVVQNSAATLLPKCKTENPKNSNNKVLLQCVKINSSDVLFLESRQLNDIRPKYLKRKEGQVAEQSASIDLNLINIILGGLIVLSIVVIVSMLIIIKRKSRIYSYGGLSLMSLK